MDVSILHNRPIQSTLRHPHKIITHHENRRQAIEYAYRFYGVGVMERSHQCAAGPNSQASMAATHY